MNSRLLATALGLLSIAPLHGQTAAPPRTFLIQPAVLVAQKVHLDPALLALVQHEANSALKVPPQSVVDKTQTPPSGDKHDYMSMARYYWPNPDTPNHLPYVRHDGRSNPEIDGVQDHAKLTRIDEAALALALGYYFTGDERYAEHASLLLRHFYLDKDTAMKPNLDFAQAVMGENTGRGAGVLDSRSLVFAVDAIGLLAGSKSWTAADQDRMSTWFAQYYQWLITSSNGLHEQKAPNNHGSWYAAQQTSIASFLGKDAEVKQIAERVRDVRIPDQFDAQGMQKYELVRTNSFSYSAFNLEALTQVNAIVTPTGVNLYTKTPGMLAGINALLPYDKDHKWTHEQISADLEGSLCPALVGAQAYTHEAKYAEAQKRFACKKTARSVLMGMNETK